MSMMTYRATMFMIFFNYAMLIANWIGSGVFPSSSPQLDTAPGIEGIINSLSFLPDLLLTAGVLALFAFSLLIPTIQFVSMFLRLSTVVTGIYIAQLPLPLVFTVPLTMGVFIVYYMGISQYAARSTFQGS